MRTTEGTRLKRVVHVLSVLPRGLRRQGALRLTNVLPIARYAFNSVRYALALFFRSSSMRCLRRAFDLTTQQFLLYELATCEGARALMHDHPLPCPGDRSYNTYFRMRLRAHA